MRVCTARALGCSPRFASALGAGRSETFRFVAFGGYNSQVGSALNSVGVLTVTRYVSSSNVMDSLFSPSHVGVVRNAGRQRGASLGLRL